MARKLQFTQNAAACTLMGPSKFDQGSPTLGDLHWLPITFRAQFKVLVLTYQALNGFEPGYLKGCFLPYQPALLLIFCFIVLLWYFYCFMTW